MSSTFYPISQYYKELFGEKVRKIPVSIVDSCPNRKGLKGMTTCIFCDEWGSAAYEDKILKPIVTQIQEVKARLQAKHKANKFLVYFQSYTSTFSKIDYLRQCFDLALADKDVVGIVVGTRPDCISPALLRLWSEYAAKTYFSVEFGVQSFYDRQLEFLRRGHNAQTAIDAINKVSLECKIDVGVHLIFGLPEETKDDLVATAKIINSLPIQNVKLHNLHVLKNTELEQLYNQKKFMPIDLIEYTNRVGIFISNLSPKIAVHRLGAVASRWDELVAPEWTKYSLKTYQYIVDDLKKNRITQGSLSSFATLITP